MDKSFWIATIVSASVAILGTILTSWLAILQQIHPRRTKKSFKVVTVVSGVAVILGVIMSLWLSINSHFESQRDKKRADSTSLAIIDSLKTASQRAKTIMENSNATLNAQKSSSEELVKQTALNIKTQRLIETSGKDLVDTVKKVSKQIKDQMLGGDSFVEMQTINLAYDQTARWIAIIHGSNPLRDIGIRIVDLNKSSSIQEMLNNQQMFNLPFLYPGSSQLTPQPVNMDPVKGVNLNIFISASNGFTTQELRMRLVHGSWIGATRITGLNQKKGDPPLYEKINPNYPIKDKNIIFK